MRHDFVPLHLKRLIDEGAECAACPMATVVSGLFQMARPFLFLPGCQAALFHLEGRQPMRSGATWHDWEEEHTILDRGWAAMNSRVFSVILLPTAECNVACTYCFEHKEPHRLSMAPRAAAHQAAARSHRARRHRGMRNLLAGRRGDDHGPSLVCGGRQDHGRSRRRRGRRFTHYLQTNLISYSPAWNDVLRSMFGGSLGTSMDFPNLHRKLFKGGADAYTASGPSGSAKPKPRASISASSPCSTKAASTPAPTLLPLLHRGTRTQKFPGQHAFPRRTRQRVEAEFHLDKTALAEFLAELFDIWMERGHANGVSLGPFDSLIHHFTGAPARLPCIWKENCSNQFISVDSKGTVAQCDCWVTSYPESFFGNVFRDPDLTQMLRTSPARREFVERPKHLVEHEDCLECRFLSICHGGCPVRTYSALGTMLAKDPYCEVYKAVFGRAEPTAEQFYGAAMPV